MADEKVKADRPDVRFEAPLNSRPFSSIVKLTVNRSNGRERGSGFLTSISSRFVIVTAGHCLTEADSVVIKWPNIAKTVTKHERYKWSEKPDYGIIVLQDDDVPDTVKINHTVLLPHTEKVEEQHSILISGYPKEIYCGSKFAQENAGLQYMVCLREPKKHHIFHFLLYEDPTSGGMSGGPVFYKCGQNSFAFGIHIKGFDDEGSQNEYCNESEEDNPQNAEIKLSNEKKHCGVQPDGVGDSLIKRHNVALLLTTDIIKGMEAMVKEIEQPLGSETAGGRKCDHCVKMKKRLEQIHELSANVDELSLNQ